MRRLVALLLAAATTLGFSSTAEATTYSLWIHGRNTDQNTQTGNYNDWTYWGSSATAAGVNKRSVNWDGVSHLSVTNVSIRAALDRYCTGSNWCNVATHSTGGAHIGYALALWGGSSRPVHNATTGVATGATQTGWNINWIDDAASAAGGTELANMGYWAVSDYITNDLRTGTIRPMYNHNETRGKWRYAFVGSSGTLYSGTLPGQDDEVIAYHSAGGVNYANMDGSNCSTGSYCNPGDSFCDTTLSTGSGNMNWSWSCGFLWLSTCYGNAYKWSNHTVYYRDDGENYNHYTNGSWGGITSKARADMAAYSYGTETPDTSTAVIASCAQESCGHALNATGSALSYSPGVNNSSSAAACSPCAQRVCERDSYCCTNSWDSICVSEARNWCGCMLKIPRSDALPDLLPRPRRRDPFRGSSWCSCSCRSCSPCSSCPGPRLASQKSPSPRAAPGRPLPALPPGGTLLREGSLRIPRRARSRRPIPPRNLPAARIHRLARG